jgi:hypothetical protein
VNGLTLLVDLLGAQIQRFLRDSGWQAADLLHVSVVQVWSKEVASMGLLDTTLAALRSANATGDSTGYNTAKDTDEDFFNSCLAD